jgi:hypothetical protein
MIEHLSGITVNLYETHYRNRGLDHLAPITSVL